MGRKTQTYAYDSVQQHGRRPYAPFRNLGPLIRGVIFGCTNETYDECVNGGLFGEPRATPFVPHFPSLGSVS